MKIKILYLPLIISIGFSPALSQSNLLESVKKNPNNAIEICKKLKQLNSKGISASSDEAVNYISKKNNLSPVNAEILSIYIIGLHCPNVV